MFWQFNFLFSTKNCTDLESGITAQKNIWHVLHCNIKLLQYKKISHSNTQVFLRAHSHDELIRLQFAVDALCGKNFDFFIISSNATNNYTLEVECSDRADEQLLTIIMGIIGKIIFFQKNSSFW